MIKFSRMVSGVMIAMSFIEVTHAENTWTGFYAGVNGGLVVNDVQLTSEQLAFTNPSETCNMGSDFYTFSPGIQFGYMHQFPNQFVSGVEASVNVNTNQTNSLSCKSAFNSDVYDQFTFRNQMQTLIKGRVGHTLNWNQYSLLPYVTGGASFAKVGLTYKNEGGDYYSNTTTRTGLLIGAGVEWAFMQHWSLRAEYYYADYGRAISLQIPTVYGLNDPNGRGEVDLSSNNVLVALSYWV